MAKGNKRYICSFIKEINRELVPNVVVVVAPNNIIARMLLCNQHDVENVMLNPENAWRNNKAGIKSIRLSDTNTYVDDDGNCSHDPRT
jgi:hypothetical protein